MRVPVIFLALALALSLPARASVEREVEVPDEYCALSDTLTVLMRERTGFLKGEVSLKKVLKRSKRVDLYFSRELGDFKWTAADVRWFRRKAAEFLPERFRAYPLGEIFARRVNLKELPTPELPLDGKARAFRFSRKDPGASPTVRELGAPTFSKGLQDRHIALWQSHGRYYNDVLGEWEWQRPALFGTIEDMLTLNFTTPFLIPMLENAGAYVLTPRERDWNRDEYVADNDPSFEGDAPRICGAYSEKGAWKNGPGAGFRDFRAEYELRDNPFAAGTARTAECSSRAEAVWEFDVRERGTYAVYISYASTEHSSPCAHYSVYSRGGRVREFSVDQRRGGGTWMYLGSFEFEGPSRIVLDTSAPKGLKHPKGATVSADAVRIGGGMGKIARGPSPDSLRLSGLPAFAEGALYSMGWAGMLDSLSTLQWDREYTCDYASRGVWVDRMRRERGVPFDLSLAFHTDAGRMQADSTVGTLAIYSLWCERSRKFPGGGDRLASRTYADFVQTQICRDIRAAFCPDWQRRGLWDRSYSESRTSGVPAMLLELLSHQNFADMKYALDPSFRFAVSRSVYKGILKFLSAYYGFDYAVQPLPVRSFSVALEDGEALLKWSERPDSLEPTASPDTYIIYTRVGDGVFDAGREVRDTSLRIPIEPGVVYSFKVVAKNEGGVSFPSNVLCCGIPLEVKGREVVLLDGALDVSGPAVCSDASGCAGFDYAAFPGVPYKSSTIWIGEQYEFNVEAQYVSNSEPGFGASFDDLAGRIQPGNSFDNVYERAVRLLERGIPVSSR